MRALGPNVFASPEQIVRRSVILAHADHDPVLALVSRSAEPNARIAADLMAVIARRDIARGERITIAFKT